MKNISGEDNFLLSNSTSKSIYNEFAKSLPIIDYHCHLKPSEIYNNRKYKNITELWLEKDHYKWRLMRANGIKEAFITGESSAKEKFVAWAATIERCPGNPLYHWTHLELKNFFGIEDRLTLQTAEKIWQQTNSKLGMDGLGARDFIEMSNVLLIGTTDDPLSELKDHQKLANDPEKTFQVIPTFRIDKLLQIEKSELFVDIYKYYQEKGLTIEEYILFIEKRIQYFKKHGSRSADLGIASIEWESITTDPNDTFKRLRMSGPVTKKELLDLKTYLLLEIVEMVFRSDWVFQLHYGAAPSVNDEARQRLGNGTGFDSIIDQGNIADGLLYLFNQANDRRVLPKTILYNIDGTKNTVTKTIMSCFQDNEEGIRGKIQHGPAWWFQDTLRGNQRQLEDLAEQGILMNFIGMTTDSRSFLSYARHDYFRRILCDCLGKWIENNEIFEDAYMIQTCIEDIAYKNALRYFEPSLEGITSDFKLF